MFDLVGVIKVMKIKAYFQLKNQWNQSFNFGSNSPVPRSKFSVNLFDLFWVPNFIKIGAHLNVATKFSRIYNITGSKKFFSYLACSICSACQISLQFEHILILESKLLKYVILGQDYQLQVASIFVEHQVL